MWGSWKQYETTKAKKWQWPLSKCSPEIKVILMLTCWCPVKVEVGVISLQCRYTEQQQIAYEDFQNEEISIWWKALVERSGTALVALSALTSPTVTQLEPNLSKTYLYLPWKWLEITWRLWEWDKAVVWEQLGPTYSPWLWWKWHSLWEPRRWLEGSQFVQESWTNYRDFWIPRSLWWKQINISQFPHICEKETARRRIKTIKTGFFGWLEIN